MSSAVEQLQRMVMGNWNTHIVGMFAQLKLADIIGSDSLTVEEINNKLAPPCNQEYQKDIQDLLKCLIQLSLLKKLLKNFRQLIQECFQKKKILYGLEQYIKQMNILRSVEQVLLKLLKRVSLVLLSLSDKIGFLKFKFKLKELVNVFN